MRCKNCGWPNEPGETTCKKCHAPLDASPIESSTIVQNPPMPDMASELKKTVLEPRIMNQPVDNRPVASGNNCPQCGFPLRPNSEKCPKCGTPVVKGNMVNNNRQDTVIDGIGLPNPNTPNDSPYSKGVGFKHMNNAQKTVNPYLEGFEPVPACTLKPIKRSSERKGFDSVEYEGEEILLNRGNTDPENVTIASEEQAVITKENGKWYIVDKSETKTTFVQASNKTELEDGSVILLGNRLFEFHIQ